MKSKSRDIAKLAIRLIALAAFIASLAFGMLKLWSFLVIAGLAASLFPGRLYCRWCCPTRTAIDALEPVIAALGMPRLSTKKTAILRKAGIAFSSVFLCLFVMSMALGWRGRLFPALTALGILFTAAFSPSPWCAFFCPCGLAFGLLGKISCGRRKKENAQQDLSRDHQRL